MFIIAKQQNQNNLVMSLMSFIEGKRIHGLGEHSASQASGCSSQGILGESEMLVTGHRGIVEIGHDCGGGREFPYKASRSYLLG